MNSLREKVMTLERNEIISALEECKGVMAKAARKLGISERMIGHKVRKYKILKEEVGSFRDRDSVRVEKSGSDQRAVQADNR